MNHIKFAQPYFLREVMGVGSVMAGEEDEENQWSTNPGNQLYSSQIANPGDASQATASDFYSQSSTRQSGNYNDTHQGFGNEGDTIYDPATTDPYDLDTLTGFVDWWVRMMSRGGAANQISGLMGYVGLTWQMWFDFFYNMFFGGAEPIDDGGDGFGQGG